MSRGFMDEKERRPKEGTPSITGLTPKVTNTKYAMERT